MNEATKMENLILKKLDDIEQQVVALRVETKANQVVTEAQHARITHLEETTRKTIWWVFGGAGTTIAAVLAAIIASYLT